MVHSESADLAELKTGRIVVGVDGSNGSDAALHWAVDEAARRGATVSAIFAWQFPPVGAYTAPPLGGYEEMAQRVLRAAKDKAAAWHPEVPFTTVPCVGAAVPALMDAGRHADLLVLGRRGRSRFQEILVGSTAYECADYAECPVVVVPTPDADGRPVGDDGTDATEREVPVGPSGHSVPAGR